MASFRPSRSVFFPSTRREFLRRSGGALGLLAFGRYAPSFLVGSTLAGAPPPQKDRSILVVVQLGGGNDGLNTVIPFADAHYHRLRPTLAIPAGRVLRLSDTAGLHPSATGLHALHAEGHLAIVQNVGYPNPNRSHFRSAEIWETGSSSNDFLPTGWLGRFFDHTCTGAPIGDLVGIHATSGLPPSFVGEAEHPTFGIAANTPNPRRRGDTVELLETFAREPAGGDGNLAFLQHTLMDTLVVEKKLAGVLGAYRPAAPYPTSEFATSLRNIAALIAAGLPTRVYFTSLAGFDTHNRQADTHARLLAALSEGLGAFQRDLIAHRLDDQVLTMTFSEFGRRPAENESQGTDHGTAAPLFVMGTRVHGGLHGTAPSLDLAREQDLTFSTDFRSIYATVLQDWLGCPPAPVLGHAFPRLKLIA